MTMRGVSIITVIFLLLNYDSLLAQAAYPEDLEQLHQNAISYFLDEDIKIEEVQRLLDDMQTDGSWNGIDYASQERGAWEPRQHLTNLLNIALAYHARNTPFYEQKNVSEKIHLSLNYWLSNDFICPNWWYPVIGVPMVLNPIMLLMEDELSKEQMELALAILGRCEIGKTGQNKVWQSGNVLLTSLLTKDAEMVKKASASIQEELVVSLSEGVQPDWSYHQHGPQLQFGNYGLSYVGDMIKWIRIMRDTPFRFDEARIYILRNYLLKGQQWVVWKDKMDIIACGRQLFVNSPESKAGSLRQFLESMKVLDTDYENVYQLASQYESLDGNKHFWRSDFQVKRNDDYYFSVKMCSERVIGAESCNSENIQGYYMGDGATFLYQSGEEYTNIFPFLDWKKIPGTTTHQDDQPLPILTCSGYRIESDFVGGVSDGSNGIAVLDYKRNGLLARKSWFMFDDMIICMGNGITSSENWNITTSINQTYLDGPVITYDGQESNVKETAVSEDLSWAWHNNTGYYFPSGGKIKIEAREVEGSWNWVAKRYPDEIMRAELFRIWIDHGINPVNGKYEYIIITNADQSRMQEITGDFPFIITNNVEKQEIKSVDGSTAGIVFYKNGASDFMDSIRVDQPCVVIFRRENKRLYMSVADPTQKLKELNVTISGEYIGGNAVHGEGETIVNISLPQEGDAGKSVFSVLNMQ
jgi:chondroitin AC lyase